MLGELKEKNKKLFSLLFEEYEFIIENYFPNKQ
jgi:hypothetical protein